MTVGELIELLKRFPADLPVAYALHSEHKLLEASEIAIENLQPARADGWVHDRWSGQPPLPTRPYLVFPGN